MLTNQITLKRSWGRLEQRNRSALLILELCGIAWAGGLGGGHRNGYFWNFVHKLSINCPYIFQFFRILFDFFSTILVKLVIVEFVKKIDHFLRLFDCFFDFLNVFQKFFRNEQRFEHLGQQTPEMNSDLNVRDNKLQKWTVIWTSGTTNSRNEQRFERLG